MERSHDSQIVRAKKSLQLEPRWIQLQISIRHQPTDLSLTCYTLAAIESDAPPIIAQLKRKSKL